MKTFLGIISKQRPIDAKLQERINLIASRALACSPGVYRCEVWRSPSQKTALYNFTNEPLQTDGPSLWSSETKAFTASGYFNTPSQVIADTIFNHCRSGQERQKAIRNAGGLYSACFADGETDTITVWNTITRIIPVYWLENQHCLVVAPRALMVHLLAQDRVMPEYNMVNLGYFLNNGYYNCEYTPYQDVAVLAPNSQLTLSLQGVHIDPLDETENEARNPDAAFYDGLAGTLIESLQPVKKHPGKFSLGITGGKDSRLLAAALKFANIDFDAYTSGFPEAPEVLVGQMVAKALQIPHRVDSPTLQEFEAKRYFSYDILTRTQDCLFVSDGMLSASENTSRYNRFQPGKVRLGGHGGELLRGGYANSMRDCDPNRVKGYFENQFLQYAAFFEPEPLKIYRQDLSGWLDSQPNWLTLPDLGAAYYLIHRCGRWSAAGVAAFTTGYYFYAPFFDAKLVKMIRPLPASYLMNEELVYNLLKRLAPDLVDIPFYQQRWRFEAKGPLPGEEEVWRKRTPIIGNNAKADFDWKQTCLTDMKEAFWEQIFHTSSAANLFQIVNRDAVQRLFDHQLGTYTHAKISPFLWNLYSASVLLSNQWLQEGGQKKLVTIRIPDPIEG